MYMHTNALVWFGRPDVSYFLNLHAYRLVHETKQMYSFPGECPHRFFDSNRDFLHNSFMYHCEDLTYLPFFCFLFLV